MTGNSARHDRTFAGIYALFEHAIKNMRRMFAIALTLLLAFGPLAAIADAAPAVGSASAPAADTGYAAKKPVLGGACKACPWGALADIVKTAVAPYGYDIQVCYNCAGGAMEERIVHEVRRPPPIQNHSDIVSPSLIPPPPNGPVDFGITQNNYIRWAYDGTLNGTEGQKQIIGRATGSFTGEAPHKELRLVANISAPTFLVVAVRADLGVKDLSELKQKRWPINVLWNDGMWPHIGIDVLDYYGITPKDIEASGGHLIDGTKPANRHDFDVAIFVSDLSGTPEYQIGYAVTGKYSLTYMALPDELLTKLAAKYDMEKHTMPVGFFLGMDRPITTIGWDGLSVYGRSDMPDDFGYTVAKALYEKQELLDYGIEHYSYHPQTVWKMGNVPLQPGAAKYYREMGFMK